MSPHLAMATGMDHDMEYRVREHLNAYLENKGKALHMHSYMYSRRVVSLTVGQPTLRLAVVEHPKVFDKSPAKELKADPKVFESFLEEQAREPPYSQAASSQQVRAGRPHSVASG